MIRLGRRRLRRGVPPLSYTGRRARATVHPARLDAAVPAPPGGELPSAAPALPDVRPSPNPTTEGHQNET